MGENLISSGACWNAIEADFLSTGRFEDDAPLASDSAFMLACEMSLETEVSNMTYDVKKIN